MGMDDSLTTSTTTMMMSSSSSSISICTEVRWAFKEPARALCSSLMSPHLFRLMGNSTSRACPNRMLSAQSEASFRRQGPIHSGDGVVLDINRRSVFRGG